MPRYHQTRVARAVRPVLGCFALALIAVGIGADPAPAQGPDEWVVPERRARLANPIPASTEASNRGRDLYRKECESCHGKIGRGDGQKAGELVVKPTDLTSTRVQMQADGALYWKITEGRGDMPNSRTALTDEQRWMLVHYLRTLAPKP